MGLDMIVVLFARYVFIHPREVLFFGRKLLKGRLIAFAAVILFGHLYRALAGT